MSQLHVVIARNWHAPNITISLVKDGIALQISLEDYLTAICHELPNPVTLLTRSRLLQAIQEAAKKVDEGIKNTSSQVM